MGCGFGIFGSLCETKAFQVIFACMLPHICGFIVYNFVNSAKIPSEWYHRLAVPWRPAGIAYRPLWTLLFTGTGYAAYLVWRDAGGCKGSAITPIVLWFTQLTLNLSWGPIFFRVRNLELALANRVVLWLSVLLCVLTFHCINPHAANIMLAYLLWVSVSCIHNYRIWKFNPQLR